MAPIVPVLIVITGLPCTGKSMLAAAIESRLHWPVLAKDDIKERLFASLGWSDRAWSRKLSAASYELLLAQARQLLVNGISCAIEGNFRPSHHDVLQALVDGLQLRCIQILCKAPGEVLITRFLARARSGRRHPGHVDLESFPELEPELRSSVTEAAPISSDILEFNSTELRDESVREFVNALANRLLAADHVQRDFTH